MSKFGFTSRLFLSTCGLLAPLVGKAAQDSAPAQMMDESAALQIPAKDDGLPGSGPIRRQDWFQKLWLERRSTWAKRVHQDQGALVFLGDSITQGWGDDLGGSFFGTKVANRGIGGDTSRGVLIRLKEDVIALHPRGVVLLIGTNDIEENATIQSTADNIHLIIQAVEQSDPHLPIVVCQVFPSSPEKHRSPKQIRQLNTAIGKAVGHDPRVTLVKTWAVFADANGNAPKAEFPDLLHPNAAGYAKWAEALRPVLAKLRLIDKA